MKSVLSSILLTFGFAFLAVAQTPAANPGAAVDAKASKATVYVYRYKQFVGAALEPSVYCDDAQLARMSNGRYFTVKVDAGKHTFHSNDKQSGIELDAKVGQEYFIRLEIATGFMKGHGRLILVSPEQAGYELKSDKLKPLDASKVVNTAMVSTEDAHPSAASASNQTQTPAAPKVVQVSNPQPASDNQ